jgi:hypothetical protein
MRSYTGAPDVRYFKVYLVSTPIGRVSGVKGAYRHKDHTSAVMFPPRRRRARRASMRWARERVPHNHPALIAESPWPVKLYVIREGDTL